MAAEGAGAVDRHTSPSIPSGQLPGASKPKPSLTLTLLPDNPTKDRGVEEASPKKKKAEEGPGNHSLDAHTIPLPRSSIHILTRVDSSGSSASSGYSSISGCSGTTTDNDYGFIVPPTSGSHNGAIPCLMGALEGIKGDPFEYTMGPGNPGRSEPDSPPVAPDDTSCPPKTPSSVAHSSGSSEYSSASTSTDSSCSSGSSSSCSSSDQNFEQRRRDHHEYYAIPNPPSALHTKLRARRTKKEKWLPTPPRKRFFSERDTPKKASKAATTPATLDNRRKTQLADYVRELEAQNWGRLRDLYMLSQRGAESPAGGEYGYVDVAEEAFAYRARLMDELVRKARGPAQEYSYGSAASSVIDSDFVADLVESEAGAACFPDWEGLEGRHRVLYSPTKVTRYLRRLREVEAAEAESSAESSGADQRAKSRTVKPNKRRRMAALAAPQEKKARVRHAKKGRVGLMLQAEPAAAEDGYEGDEESADTTTDESGSEGKGKGKGKRPEPEIAGIEVGGTSSGSSKKDKEDENKEKEGPYITIRFNPNGLFALVAKALGVTSVEGKF